MPPEQRPAGHLHVEHPCSEGCGAWGAFGFAPDPMLPKAERVMRWYCAAHRAIGEAELARWKASAEATSTEAPAGTPGQGRLL
ncbi:hypothetical protein [Inquilinus sp. CA228]|uniref:hypothetical protein n=1 Tax=Inquilinus sp. CA228 TaxID=3455609 RepID=UPI003F8CF305